LGGAGAKSVTPEQMELARLRAELAKTKMKSDIVKKSAERFAKHSISITHLSQAQERMAGVGLVLAAGD
jgi:hypothetical protein